VHSGLATGETAGFSNAVSLDSDDYRRVCFELQQYEKDDGTPYFAFGRYLGKKPGSVPNDVYSNIPDTGGSPLDVLFIADYTFGGLEYPLDCKNYFWLTVGSQSHCHAVHVNKIHKI
jgi:hypothetical protein